MAATKARISTLSDAAKLRRTDRRWAAPYLFVMALIVPLLYSTATIDPVELPRFLVLSGLGIVVVSRFGMAVTRSAAILTVTRAEAIVLGCLVAYLLVAAISSRIAGATPDGNFELLKLVTFTGSIYVTSRAVRGEAGKLALLSKFVIVASFFVGGFAILQYYQIALFEWMKLDTTVDSTMGHRNLLASFLVLALPFVIYAFLELNGRWRLAGAVTMLLSAFLLVTLQTRAVWVAFPAGLACSAIALMVAGKLGRPIAEARVAYGRRAIGGAALMAVGSSLALVLYSPVSRAPMREHVGSMVQLGNASVHERLELWSRTIRMIGDHPLTGVGLGNWRIVLPTYGTEGLRSETGTLHFQRPHNDFLWVASETGLLGGLLYLAMFVSVLVLAVLAMVRARSKHDRLVAMLMLLGVGCYCLDSLFSFPKERTSHTVYLALLIGTLLSFAPASIAGGPAAKSFSRRQALALLAVMWVSTLVAGRFAWSRFRAETHLRRALEARASQDWPRMVAQLDRIDPRFYDLDPSAAPIAWYRGVARFEMGDKAGAWTDFSAAHEVHPNHAHVLNNIATCQALRGESEDAIRSYRRAIEVAPRFEEARINLASVLHDQGRDSEAYEVLAPCVATSTSPRFEACLGLVKSALGHQP